MNDFDPENPWVLVELLGGPMDGLVMNWKGCFTVDERIRTLSFISPANSTKFFYFIDFDTIRKRYIGKHAEKPEWWDESKDNVLDMELK